MSQSHRNRTDQVINILLYQIFHIPATVDRHSKNMFNQLKAVTILYPTVNMKYTRPNEMSSKNTTGPVKVPVKK